MKIQTPVDGVLPRKFVGPSFDHAATARFLRKMNDLKHVGIECKLGSEFVFLISEQFEGG